MLAAATDTTVLAAFAVGFVSFISPCVLPLVPGYLSAVSGVSLGEIRTREHGLSRVVVPATIFCLSFTAMFVALGMTATGIGSTLRDNQDLLNRLAGGTIIVMGTFFLLTPFVARFNRDWRPEVLIEKAGAGGPIVAGLAFAVAWTPCVGPTLASILAAASTSDTVGKGGILLAFYSLGLAVPFMATAIAFDRATTVFRWLRDRHTIVTVVSGLILIAMGTLILTGEMSRLNREAQDLLESVGLDFIYSL